RAEFQGASHVGPADRPSCCRGSMHLSSPLVALAVVAVLIASSPAAAAGPSAKPAFALIVHLRAPASSDLSLAAADVALRAPEEIGDALNAMRMHPGARLSFAICPAYLGALERAAAGDTALASAASGAS